MPMMRSSSHTALLTGHPPFSYSTRQSGRWEYTRPGLRQRFKNFGPGIPPFADTINGHNIDTMERFTNLESDVDSSVYLSPDIRHRIGLATSTMARLDKVWSNRRLHLSSKLCVYNTHVLPILLYNSETWTLLKENGMKLQVFHMRCQWQLLGVRWSDFVTNVTISESTGFSNIRDIIARRRHSFFAISGDSLQTFQPTWPSNWASTYVPEPNPAETASAPQGHLRNTWIKF